MKRAALAEVMRPKLGELKKAWPAGFTWTLRLVLGPSKFV